MKEKYGMIIDLREPDPRKCISYPLDCDNREYEPWSLLWGNSFLVKDSYFDTYRRLVLPTVYYYSETYGDNEKFVFYITNVPEDKYKCLKMCAVAIPTMEETIVKHNCRMMMSKRRDCDEYIKGNKDWIIK